MSIYKTYVLHFNLSKNNYRYTMCPNKSISRLFAENLNDFNIHLFGQTIYYSVSPSLNVPSDPLPGK